MRISGSDNFFLVRLPSEKCGISQAAFAPPVEGLDLAVCRHPLLTFLEAESNRFFICFIKTDGIRRAVDKIDNGSGIGNYSRHPLHSGGIKAGGREAKVL